MSSQIYELFGYLTEDKSPKAMACRAKCLCPFTGEECDGGGNRYQSFLNLRAVSDKDLIRFFHGRKTKIPAGVCSLIISGKTWIVCPRRLFVLDHGAERTSHEKFCENLLQKYNAAASRQKTGVWSEVKIRYKEYDHKIDDDIDKTFDYTFDYIVCSTSPKPIGEIVETQGCSEQKLQSMLLRNGYTIARRNKQIYVEEYPDGTPIIIEVMTSSTSGGNKAKGTTVQNAFREAILGLPHKAPGINYRQIWARMVSQLIVKSQIGKAWGGQTVWVLQDALVDYISKTTDLNLKKLMASVLQEVNILALKLNSSELKCSEPVPLEVDNLYAGPIPKIQGDTDFNKLLQAANVPPKAILEAKLLAKRPRTFITL